MKALLIDPIARTVTEIDAPRLGNAVSVICDILDADMIEPVDLAPAMTMWVDEEGRYQYPHPRGYFEMGGVLFVGAAVVTGGDAHLPCPVPASWIIPFVKWRDTPSEDEAAPQITVTFDDWYGGANYDAEVD